MQETERMSLQALEARRAYQKEWRAANRDKVRERNRRYWERRAARLAADRQEQEHEQTGSNWPKCSAAAYQGGCCYYGTFTEISPYRMQDGSDSAFKNRWWLSDLYARIHCSNPERKQTGDICRERKQPIKLTLDLGYLQGMIAERDGFCK